MKSESYWKIVISHYEQLVSKGFDYRFQLNIVEKIVNSSYAESLFPTTSHFALNISRIEDFHESFDFPSICIQYFGNETFKISYSPNLKQTHKILTRKCHYQGVWTYLESLFLRQKIETDLVCQDHQ